MTAVGVPLMPLACKYGDESQACRGFVSLQDRVQNTEGAKGDQRLHVLQMHSTTLHDLHWARARVCQLKDHHLVSVSTCCHISFHLPDTEWQL